MEFLSSLLVPLTSAGIGLIIGNFISHLNVRFQARESMRQTTMAIMVEAKLKAYQSILNCLSALAVEPKKDSFAALYDACSAAALLASPETVSQIGLFQQAIMQYESSNHIPKNFDEVKLNLIAALHDDLYTFSLIQEKTSR